MGTLGRGQLSRQSGSGIALAQGAKQIQRHDVASALPDGVQWHFAVDARHDAVATFLHVTVATQALHGFLRKGAAALAYPEFGHRREQPRHDGFMRVARVVERAGQADG